MSDTRRRVGSVVLYLLLCRACGVLFAVCQRCYSGQVCCGEECRRRRRRSSLRAANKRDQQSVEGRRDHADRQRAYRARNKSKALARPDEGVPVLRSTEDETSGACAPPVTIVASSEAIPPVGQADRRTEKVTDHGRSLVSAFPTLTELRSCPRPGGNDGTELPLPPRRSSGGLVCIVCGQSGPVLDRRREGRFDRSRALRPHPAPVLR